MNFVNVILQCFAFVYPFSIKWEISLLHYMTIMLYNISHIRVNLPIMKFKDENIFIYF